MQEVLCSTPSGIKGRNADDLAEADELPAICSTPSGIKGRNAGKCPRFVPVVSDAQRLPASKEETQASAKPTYDDLVRCSTPSGIKGRNASRIWCGVTLDSLCSTPSGIKGRNATVSCSDSMSTV